jgi:predicted dehydrogenase
MIRSERIGFAVVGLGNIAQTAVLPAFSHSKRTRLVALVSRDKQKALRLAGKFGATSYYSTDEYPACLSDPEVEAVYIATPQGEHESFTVAAAATGTHVLCEKPLAANLGQAARMIAAARKHNVLLMTAYRKYFEPSILYLKKLIREGAFGRIDVIHAAFSELNGTQSSPAWLLNPKLSGGGPLMDLGIYCVNTIRWLVDENPIEVSAESWRNDRARFRDVEEGIAFQMKFQSGLVTLASTTYSSAMSSFISIQGSKGRAMLTPAFPFDEERHLTVKIGGRRVDRRFKVVDEFAPELDALAAAIQNGDKLEADGLEGYRDLEIIHAIYDSAQKRAPQGIIYSDSPASRL